MKKSDPIFKKKEVMQLYIYPQDEYFAETVDLDAICGVEDRIMCEENHSFVPINDSGINPDIDANDGEANDDKNEENNDEDNVKSNDATLDCEDGGIIMNDGPIEYDEFNIHITVVHFSMGGRHAVF